MGGGKSAPPPPDYRSAAEETSRSSELMTQRQTWANRPDQTTAWGGMKWTPEKVWDPTIGANVTKWHQEEYLRPELEAALNAEVGQQEYRTSLAHDLMGRIAEGYEEKPDFSQFGDPAALRQQGEDRAWQGITGRLDPMWDNRANDLEVKLRNQGLRPGDEAYDRAMMTHERARTDAYQQGSAQAQAEGRAETGLGAQLRQQQIAEYLQERGVPLNEVNAIMFGQQVSNPAMPSFNAASKAEHVDYSGAARDQFNAEMDVASHNQKNAQMMMEGITSVGSMAMMCDRRFKRNIKRVGEWKGYPIYEFEYLWGEKSVGPMADEVNQDAVVNINGVDYVDLGRVA